MTLRADRLAAALRAAFQPISLAIEDESARHAGHAGASEAGQTHYRVTMVAACFSGQSRLARSRAVHAAVADEFGSGLHALSLRLQSPEELLDADVRLKNV